MIYADHAATTPLAPQVLDAMLPYLKEQYGNASSLYRLGRRSRQAIEDARKTVAALLGAIPAEVYFTSGGTEADNWALKGIARKLADSGKRHIVTSSIEHHAVLNAAKALEKEGFTVTYLKPDRFGFISPEAVQAAVRPDTALVSVMYANNEIGSVQPIGEIGAACREEGVLFHTDAVQAAGTLPIDVKAQSIDLLSLSAHKFYGPKGVGVLFCRRGVFPQNLLDGGSQEKGRRAGTENPALIVGLAEALKLSYSGAEERIKHVAALRDRVQAGLLTIEGSRLNGGMEPRLPGIVNVSFSGIDGQSLLFQLDLDGVAASSGAACASGSVEPSHVLLALGVPYAQAHGSLRISLGPENTAADAEEIILAVKNAVTQLRNP